MEILFILFSTAFADGDMIPVLYTADGQDISPPLSWSIYPGTSSYVLICEDPDAPVGNWVHWVVYNIPDKVNSFEEGVPGDSTLECCANQGTNSWGSIGYGGPAPPSGTHRYFFRLYALDTMLDLEPGATEAAVRRSMDGHILHTAELMGMYGR
jgi:Raf kinase inhibitor-like YbhB/YbcL family protein